LTGRNSIFK